MMPKVWASPGSVVAVRVYQKELSSMALHPCHVTRL
ncbi:hypothetical protein J3R03_000266 [Actinoplanes couchii]|nr:hypothetical protein [Actinoplanes couchii]